MKTVVIEGESRKVVGKKDTKKLRASDRVPCVLYGDDKPVHFHCKSGELRKVVYTPNVYLIDLKIDGNNNRAIMQDMQWHPVDEQILHVDFLRIDNSKKIKIEIPVAISGMAAGIKAGGRLASNLRKLKVRAFPKDLPDSFEVNVEDLEIGDNIKIEDLNFGDVEFLDNKSSVIVGVTVTRASMLDIPEGEETEGEEEAEATSEEGAAEAGAEKEQPEKS